MKREQGFDAESQAMRDQAARHIKFERSADRERELHPATDYSRSRGALEYVGQLKGLNHFFSYVRSLSFGKGRAELADLGAGNTRAISELKSQEDLSYNIDFKAVSLTRDPEVAKYLGQENLYRTSMEKMRGIKDGELAGAISVFAAGHSGAPDLVAKSLDRVLMPSGAFKTIYVDDAGEDAGQKVGPHAERHERLLKALRDLKFDVATGEFYGPDLNNMEKVIATVVVAIKPPVVGVNARELLAMDWKGVDSQLEALENKGFKETRHEIMQKHVNKQLPDEIADIIKKIRKHIEDE